MRGLSCFIVLSLVALSAAAARADVPQCKPGSYHLPHPTDCSKYYACTNGVAVLQECPPGLWYSQEQDACDFPENVQCVVDGSTTTAGPTTTTGTPSTTADGGTDLPDCHGTTDTLLPHPTDCTKFYKCLAGIPVLQNCPPGLWWHQEILGCDWPEQSECTPGATGGTKPPTEPSTSSTTPSGSTTTDSLPTEPPAGLPDHCPSPGVEGEDVRLPHETSCRFYYRCGINATSLYVCPPDEHFSPTKRVCRNRSVAGCDSCPSEEEPGDEVRLPHETDCHLYYHCEEGQRVLYQCRTVGWHLSRSTRVCMEPADAKCT